jgi:hypothetical protein
MNTPGSKPIIRFPERRGKRPAYREPRGGSTTSALLRPDFQQVVGVIVTQWAWLEEFMIRFMSLLLNDPSNFSPARQIFRSVNSTQGRITIMRSLLEESAANKDKGPLYDEMIDEFEALTKERNNYVHGLWWTEGDGSVTRADASTNAFDSFNSGRPVSLKQAQHVAQRISALAGRVFQEWTQHLQSQPERRPQPPDKAG